MNILIAWTLIPIVVVLLSGRGALDQLFVGIAPGVILIAALALSRIKNSYFFVFILILANMFFIFQNFPTNKHIFFQAPQPEVRYSDQLKVIEEIDRRAGSTPFEVQAYTIPYFWQDGWTYLFWWRGKMPVPEKGEKLFAIIQKDRANPTFQNNWYRDTVTKWGSLLDTFTIGEYSVEERKL